MKDDSSVTNNTHMMPAVGGDLEKSKRGMDAKIRIRSVDKRQRGRA